MFDYNLRSPEIEVSKQILPTCSYYKEMEEIKNFQQEPDESLFRAGYLTDMQEVILFYNGLDVPTRQILDSKGAIPTKTVADVKVAIQEMVEYSQKWHNRTSRTRSTKTFDGLAAIQAQLNSHGREIKKVNEKVYAAQVRCELCKGPHYTKDCPLKEDGKTLEEAYYTHFGAPYQPGGQYRAAGPGFYQQNIRKSLYPDRNADINRQSAVNILFKCILFYKQNIKTSTGKTQTSTGKAGPGFYQQNIKTQTSADINQAKRIPSKRTEYFTRNNQDTIGKTQQAKRSEYFIQK
ncbi:hypothetical protein Tco_0995456 [Tanacetum coccineum]